MTEAKGPLTRACEELGLERYVVGQTLKDAGWTREDLEKALESGKPWFHLCERQAAERDAASTVRSRLPVTFRGLSFDAAMEKLHPKLRRAVGEYDGSNAALLGPTGCGKSLAGGLMLQKQSVESYLDRRIRMRNNLYFYDDDSVFIAEWVSAQALFADKMRHPLGDGEPELLRKAKRASLLVLDDISWAEKDDVTNEVMAHRYDSAKPTIVTCGLSKAKMLERFGDAFARRMIESSGERGVFVDCSELG